MLTASLVLYHNSPAEFGLAIASFLASTTEGEIWISDNSTVPLEHPLFKDPRVHYMFNGANLGFGAAHNRAIDQLPVHSDLHLLLNPDIRFDPPVLPALRSVMARDSTIGAVMPRIIYPDGSLQRLAKLLPTPLDLFVRRFIPISALRSLLNRRYELHDLPQNTETEVPTLSGCFLLVRTDALRQVGGFDERYFMYMEDFDLVRRIGDFSKIVYVPTSEVIHGYAKGSYVNRKLLGFHLSSALRYFTKWGWIIDRERSRRNAATLWRVFRQSGPADADGV